MPNVFRISLSFVSKSILIMHMMFIYFSISFCSNELIVLRVSCMYVTLCNALFIVKT